MEEAMTITFGKGGVGKNSVCINMDMILAQKDCGVCPIDVDLGLKNLGVMLGLENRVIYDLKDVTEGCCTLANAMIRDKRQGNLYLLPACKTIHIQYFHGEDLKIVVKELRSQFDYILLDTPAGIENGFVHSIACMNRATVVATLDVTALQDADRIIGILMKGEMERVSFIVSRINIHRMDRDISVSLKETKQWLSIDFLSYVFDDGNMMRSNNHGKPIVLQWETQTYSCLDNIVRRMLRQRYPLPKYRERKFLQKLFR